MEQCVSERTMNETRQCRHAFSCLATGQCGDYPLCEVDSANGDCFLTLKTRDCSLCPYRLAFGHRQVCRCPTHFALHHRHRR